MDQRAPDNIVACGSRTPGPGRLGHDHPMFEYDEQALRRIGDTQAQVATRAQLRGLGLVDWHIRARVRSRRWRLVGAHCVVLHRGPLDEEAKR